jgi:hypothetical protein
LGLKNKVEWFVYTKGALKDKGVKPDDIPTSPAWVYEEKGWAGFDDWLGTGTITTFKGYRSFEDAREFVRGLGLKSGNQWFLYSRGKLKDKDVKPEDIPTDPYLIYQDKGWVDIRDWLGLD